MATLEKIRNQSVLLLIIVGVALVLFIFMGSERILGSFFGPGTTLAKIDGHSIDVTEFQQRVEEKNQLYQAQDRKVDMADLQAAVLDEMISEALFDQEIADLGIVVTDQELSEFMLGKGAKIVDQRVAQLSGGQITSAQQLYDMAFNSTKYGLDQATALQLQKSWASLESDMEKALLQQKFNSLFTGTLVANELDAQALYNEGAKTSTILFAKQDYSSLPDDKFTVTDDEIQAEYNRTKNRYRLTEETRTVSYITVDITPSATDKQAMQKKVDAALTTLGNPDGAKELSADNSFVVSTQTTPAAKITDRQVKAFLDSAAVGQVKDIVSIAGTEHNLVKLLGKSAAVDSINIDVAFVEGKAQLDSLIKGLNDGTIKYADAVKDASVKQSNDSIWLSMFDSQVASLKDVLAAQSVGTFFTPDADETTGGRLFRIRSRRAEVPVYEYVTAQITTEPSAVTVSKLLGDLNAFIEANPNAADFTANAPKSNYTVQTAVITPSSVHLGQVPESRSAVRWAMRDAKAGQVSPVFGSEESGRYIVVAVDNVYKGSYVPATEPKVRDILEAKVRNDKKAAELIGKYKGKATDVPGYAKLMGVEADTTQVNFAQPMIAKIGADGKLAAAVSVAGEGKVVGPIQGENGVVAFVVTSVENSSQPYDYKTNATQYQSRRGGSALVRNLPSILVGRNKLKNNSLYFFREN